VKLFITSIVILLLLFSLRETLAETEIIETENQDADSYEQALKDRLISLARNGDAVNFRFNKTGYAFRINEKYAHEFTISQNETFSTPPDNHGSIQYTLTTIDSESVTLQYESYFDHRSFGPDQITIDRGIFKLPYTGSVD